MSRSDAASALCGVPVLDAVTDPDSGNVLFHLGKWQKRAGHIDNPNLSATAQVAEGSHSLFIQHCYWELDLRSEFPDLAGLPLHNVPPAQRPTLFRHLIGDRIAHAGIAPDNVLTVVFESEAKLVVATRTAERWLHLTEYSVHAHDEYWSAKALGQVEAWTRPSAADGS